MNYSCILATDNNGGIGKKNKIPWKCLIDFKFFSINTKLAKKDKFNVVIMGRKTYESLPCELLPGRLNIVLSRKKPSTIGFLNKQIEDKSTKQVWYCDDLNFLLTNLTRTSWIDKVFIIGGASLYNLAFEDPRCKSIYLTQIKGNYGCDVKVNLELLKSNFNKIVHTPFTFEKDIKYSFQYWIRN
jgi:dihydrofolate reductase / thymidylate synthase